MKFANEFAGAQIEKMALNIVRKTFLLLIPGIILFSTSCKTNPPNAPENLLELGRVFISANVTGAIIWLDGNDTGKLTPDTIEAQTGVHEISLTKELYHKITGNVEIFKDTTITVNFVMQEITEFGKVYVTSNVNGAAIFIDDGDTGKLTPDTIATSPGVHQIKLQKPFYIDSTYSVTVIKDSIIAVNIDLTEEPLRTTVLLEDFANVSCVPCVISNKIIESLTKYTYGYNKLVAIKYPTDFPSPNDPFYLANSEDCDARMGYYNILFAPTTIIDGTERPISTDSNSVKSAVDLRLQKGSRFRVHVSDKIVGSLYHPTVTIRVEDGSGITFSDLVLHTVVTETDIEFSTPPGSNGETKFFDVMRKMLPTNAGQDLSSLGQSSEETYQFQVAISPGWNIANLNVVAFIQDKNTKEVFQAGSTFE